MPGRSSSSSRSSSTRSSFSSPVRTFRSSYSSPKIPIGLPTKTTTPTPVTTSSVVTHNHQVEKPGFFSNMWSGFGLGAGQSIAMNIFRSDPVVKHVHENKPATTSNLNDNLPKEYVQCMKDNNNDKDLCKQFLEQV